MASLFCGLVLPHCLCSPGRSLASTISAQETGVGDRKRGFLWFYSTMSDLGPCMALLATELLHIHSLEFIFIKNDCSAKPSLYVCLCFTTPYVTVYFYFCSPEHFIQFNSQLFLWSVALTRMWIQERPHNLTLYALKTRSSPELQHRASRVFYWPMSVPAEWHLSSEYAHTLHRCDFIWFDTWCATHIFTGACAVEPRARFLLCLANTSVWLSRTSSSSGWGRTSAPLLFQIWELLNN